MSYHYHEYVDEIRAAVNAAMLPDTGWARTACPVCEQQGWHGNKLNLSYNVESTYFSCWRCGTKGFLTDQEHRVPRIRQVLEAASEQKLKEGPPPLPSSFEPLSPNKRYLKPYLDYVLSRGVSMETVEYLRLGAATSGYCAGCVIIPTYSVYDEYVGFVARSITEKRYHYPKGMHRESSMLNAEALLRPEPVVLVEGSFDAMPYFPFAVALLGKPTNAQREIIVAARKRVVDEVQEFRPGDTSAGKVIVALDADASRRSWTFAMELQMCGVQATYLPLPMGHDPGTAPRHLIFNALQEAM